MKKTIGWLIAIVAAIATFSLCNYLFLPRVGWSGGMLFIVLTSALVGLGAGAIYNGIAGEFDYDYDNSIMTAIVGIACGVLVLAIIVSSIAGWTMFHVDEARDRLEMTTISQEELLSKLPEVDADGAYSWADSKTVKKLASRKTGELSELISIYTIGSSDVSTGIKDGKMVKYVPLAYGGYFKANKVKNIPGYIVVDPVSQTAEYVECSFIYSPSAYFGEDLMRRLRQTYPTASFGSYTFQVSPDGVPYWVCELKENHGWFITETSAVVTLNAKTGECTRYKIGEAPEWVVAIHGTTAVEYYKSYGSLINGYWNMSQVGETSVTNDFGYVVINNQLHYYTGVTSVVLDGGDESNLGVLLYNAHTNKAEYCQIAGAEEYSAMEAAEGVVQNFGYEASFPSLTNVNGEMTYTMVLKDNNGIVKQYAMVNYVDYTIAVTADTMNACRAAYAKALANKGVVDADSSTVEEISVVVDVIEYIVQGGETTVYIRDVEGCVYKSAFDERFLFVKAGDTLTFNVVDTSSAVKVVVLK